MRSILGIDAAWTITEPSGVALVVEHSTGWKCAAVAPSYTEFLAQAEGRSTDWRQKSFSGTTPDVSRLLRAAERLSEAPLDLVALDMPIARNPFSSRRVADDAISREFGARWCSAHTPNSARPGPLGELLANDFSSAGFTLVTSMHAHPISPSLIEVYPHPALLSLLERDQRVPYKVSKARKYWPTLDVSGRISSLLQEFEAILTALTERIGPLPLELPDHRDITSLSSLKRYEDALDALICAWVGIEYINGRTAPLGDQTAAIWCPADVIRAETE